MRPSRAERLGATGNAVGTAALAVTLPLLAGVMVATVMAATLHSRNFPWITSRALGIAAYASLAALVGLGVWMRHPWRLRLRVGHAESYLRTHAALGAATVALVVGHLVFLASDAYAGVGWRGALVPGLSHYRTTAVALGVVSLYLLVAIGATARFAGATGARSWRAVHRLALPTFFVAWLHGVLSGADTLVLRPLYLATGGVVAVLAMSRLVASDPVARATEVADDPGSSGPEPSGTSATSARTTT